MNALLIITFFILFHSAMSIDCYDCQNCQSPINAQASTTTCGVNVTQCLKVTAKLGTVYTYIVKQCGPCINESFIFGATYLSVDCCTGSNCNGTNRVFILSYPCIFLILVLLYFKYRLE